ncbi:MAG: MerR family transcriptional regulator [Planctomycetota bacterium]
MKIYRIDEAARRINLPISVLQSLENEGRIQPKERIGDISYYTQYEIDGLIQDLHSSIQRASWREMEMRMEEAEERIEALERKLKTQDEHGQSHLLR